ncbi:MAG: glutathione ABC transporter permease, partial [Chloroflexota bacterium]|nr:glutathione ABC transporter permease [Chloroflexota bacterium]
MGSSRLVPLLISPPGTGPGARFLFRFRQNRLALAACGVLVLVIVAATAAPALAPYDPAHISLDDQVLAPSLEHLFGTDRLGRDVFSRVLWGARVSLGVSLLAVSLGSVVGIL